MVPTKEATTVLLEARQNRKRAELSIAIGITCEIYLANTGDQILANFGQIGSVEVSFI